MRNLMNCHCVGLHSFPIIYENGLYKRIFYAGENHELWKSFTIAVHPHHVDIKITVLEGVLTNLVYETGGGVDFKKFIWDSHILNGKGGFCQIGTERLKNVSAISYNAGQTVTMKSHELHTVHVNKNTECVWLIEESPPTNGYEPINYSPHDLEKWTPEGLYKEVGDDVKEQFIGKYLSLVKEFMV